MPMTENYSEDSMTPWRWQQSSCEKSDVPPNALHQQSQCVCCWFHLKCTITLGSPIWFSLRRETKRNQTSKSVGQEAFCLAPFVMCPSYFTVHVRLTFCYPCPGSLWILPFPFGFQASHVDAWPRFRLKKKHVFLLTSNFANSCYCFSLLWNEVLN